MFSPCYFHVIISIGILESNSLSLSTRSRTKWTLVYFQSPFGIHLFLLQLLCSFFNTLIVHQSFSKTPTCFGVLQGLIVPLVSLCSYYLALLLKIICSCNMGMRSLPDILYVCSTARGWSHTYIMQAQMPCVTTNM